MPRVPLVRNAALEAVRSGCSRLNQITPYVCAALGRAVPDTRVLAELDILVMWEVLEKRRVNGAMGSHVVFRLKSTSQAA